ncbi:hypothetical protein [Burkholderia vietnamiensis]|uniref:hypothetical protein n=1 Tax=Burkholderia vietnamiensis TaxID=60552 RepID=UPI001CF1B1DD|nr:hypothetical protein [Burkholderia vietnamiensis]MCA8448853.1 hypothetical protein [Burkholderia vietnamiensis]
MEKNIETKQSPLAVLKECLAIWWTFNRGKEVLMEDGGSYNEALSPRSRLFDRIGTLVLFDPKEMACHWDFHMVAGDRRIKGGIYRDIAARNVHDNQIRVRVRELLSKKAAKAGVVVVLLGALIAPFSVQHMTPFHPLAGLMNGVHSTAFFRF